MAPHESPARPKRLRSVLSAARPRRNWGRRALHAVQSTARPGWGRRALYAALSIPLAAAYACVFAGLVASVVFAVQGVGVLLFLLLLATVRGLGGFERRLARWLLGLDITPDARVRDERGVVRRVRRLAVASSTWRALGWLGARVLLGASVCATLAFGVVSIGALIYAAPWNAWTTGSLLGLIVVTALVTVVALDLQIRLAASVAPRLLGVAAEEKLAALRQTSARLADRNRLARDLHDTIGHSLTASLLQATAARRTLTAGDGDAARPETVDFARQALGHIETNTRTALAELDRALAVLRDEDGGTPEAELATPDLGDLEGLLAGLRDGGLPVTLTVVGELSDVPIETSRLGYRVVQEGTTNVLRHAGCPETTVEVARGDDELTVSVRNAGSADADSRPGPGGGRGLDGLRDRAAAVGGRIAAGPAPGGGYELCATLPLADAA